MARWVGHQEIEAILAAGARWREHCLIGDASAFSDEALWTSDNLAVLNRLFADHMPSAGRRFDDMLRVRLAEGRGETARLAAEAVWLTLLFPRGSVRPATKWEKVTALWWRSGAEPPESELLSDAALAGVGEGGGAFTLQGRAQLGFLIRTLVLWKRMAPQRRSALAGDPWAFASWLDGVEGSRCAMRHALLYLCFPHAFERIVSSPDKAAILRDLSDRVPDKLRARLAGAARCPVLIDRALFAIRRSLERDYGTPELDFYEEPLGRLWRSEDPSPSRLPSNGRSGSRRSAEDPLRSLFFPRAQAERILGVWRARKNIILQGPPGVGKTFAARALARALGAPDGAVSVVQFHQAYSYEDFVQGFRPVADGGFALREGAFLRFCRAATARPDVPHAFIVDEINRGNLSRILGEVMVLIEPDKRSVQWALPLAGSEPGAPPFYVPPNVHLLGLMNTADRSLAVVDHALRRRFAFFTLEPAFASEGFARELQRAGVSSAMVARIRERIGTLNEAIAADTANLGPAFRIGHSFFCGKPDTEPEDAWYRRVVETEIGPLLDEYWFDAQERAAAARHALLNG